MLKQYTTEKKNQEKYPTQIRKKKKYPGTHPAKEKDLSNENFKRPRKSKKILNSGKTFHAHELSELIL